MAFGKKQEKIDQLSEQLEQLKWAEPYIEDARAIHTEVTETLANPNSPLTAAEVAAQAVAHIRRRRLQEAYEILSTQLRDEQEQKLFEEVVRELRIEEGDAIRQRVEQSINLDPNLRRELTKRARLLLWQESEDLIVEELKQQERSYTDAEIARQKVFNRSNLDFSRNNHINLASDALLSTYKQGDILEICYPKCQCYRPHKPAVYNFAGDQENVAWRYSAGAVGGVRNRTALSTNLQLYRLGSHKANEWGRDAEHEWNSLHAGYEVHVQFFSEGVEKVDRLKFYCDSSPSIIAQATLFTPLAYAHHIEQQQN